MAQVLTEVVDYPRNKIAESKTPLDPFYATYFVDIFYIQWNHIFSTQKKKPYLLPQGPSYLLKIVDSSIVRGLTVQTNEAH